MSPSAHKNFASLEFRNQQRRSCWQTLKSVRTVSSDQGTHSRDVRKASATSAQGDLESPSKALKTSRKAKPLLEDRTRWHDGERDLVKSDRQQMIAVRPPSRYGPALSLPLTQISLPLSHPGGRENARPGRLSGLVHLALWDRKRGRGKTVTASRPLPRRRPEQPSTSREARALLAPRPRRPPSFINSPTKWPGALLEDANPRLRERDIAEGFSPLPNSATAAISTLLILRLDFSSVRWIDVEAYLLQLGLRAFARSATGSSRPSLALVIIDRRSSRSWSRSQGESGSLDDCAGLLVVSVAALLAVPRLPAVRVQRAVSPFDRFPGSAVIISGTMAGTRFRENNAWRRGPQLDYRVAGIGIAGPGIGALASIE